MINKMFFYANFRTYDNTLGITRKVYAQIEAFQKLGYSVTYCGYLEDGVAVFDENKKILVYKKYPAKNKDIQHLIRRRMLMNACIEYLSASPEHFGFAYVRYHFFDKKYIELLEKLKNAASKVVIEAHSAPKFSSKLSPMYFIGQRDSKWNKKAKEHVDLVASMSDENKLWDIQTVKISNAVDVATIPVHCYVGSTDDINFISVSFERDVHGYDRLIRGIRNYYDSGGKRNIFFHIVGTTLPSTRKLIKKLGLEKHCVLYGSLSGNDLDRVYDKANLGVGCLANHRIGSFFGSALKTKEYIAKGIPFIYGWNEKVLEKFQYAKKFELCEEPIDVFSVIDFYDGIDKTDLPEKIRRSLGKEDTWEYQMKLVVDTLSELKNH